MSSRKSKDKDRSGRKSRGDSTKNLVEIAPTQIVDSSRSVPSQPTLRRGESDDYYNPRPDVLPGPSTGYVESPTHYNGGGPPTSQPTYNALPGQNQAYGGGPPGPQHSGGGHGGYTGGGPIYHAGYGEPAPAHYSQHAGARPPMPHHGASADYYHGSGSYNNSGPPNPPLQHAQNYNVGQGQVPGGFPGAPGLQHTQSAAQHAYQPIGYTHPIPTQGQKPPRRDSSSSSSSSSYVDISRTYPLPPVRKTPMGAIRTFFTAPSESRRRVIRRKSSRTLREQRRQGRLAQGRTRSASSSEADSDLAYGSGYLRRRKRRGSRGSRSPGGRRYRGSRSPRRYGSPPRDERRGSYQPASSGGVPLPGLHHSSTMPGGFPIETLATAGAAGAIAAGLSRKDSKKTKVDAGKEILKLGEDLHNLAKKQNKFDLEEAAKRGRFNVVRHNEGRHGLGPKGFGDGETTRGIPSSKPQKPKEDDGWETSDSDDTSSSSSSADSAMAFGGENTYPSWKWREPSHPPRRSQSHQSQNQTRDQNNQHYPHPPTRKSTIVDPKLFGPQNSLLGVVERPVGFGSIDDLRGDGATPLDPPTVKQTGYFRSPLPSPKPPGRDADDIRHTKEEERKRREEPILLRDRSSRQGSTREMQHVFPLPTEDPGFVDVARASVSGTPRHDEERPSFHARTDSLPLRAPKPMSPVRREVYDSSEVSSKKGKGKEKEKDKDSSRSNDIALGGLAGAAIAAGIAYGMSSPGTERHTPKPKSKGKVRAEVEPEREIDSRRMFEDDMARRNGRRPETGPDRRDSYGFNQQPISAVSPMNTREATGGKVDPFQFQVNDDAWESSNGDKKGKKPMPAHERMAARAAESFRDSGSSTPKKYQEDIDHDKRREAEYQEQLYSSSPEMLRRGDSGVNRPLERTDSGRTRDIGQPKPFHERIAARAAESNPDTGRSSPRTAGSALDEEAERRIREVVQKWGILGKKSTGFADVVLAARKAELEKATPVYEPPAPEIKMVERAPKWATKDAPRDHSPEPVRTKKRAESPPRWRRGEDGPESPLLTRVKGEEAPPAPRRESSDADHRYASMHDDYFSSRPNHDRPRERRRGRSRTRSPSPPRRGRSRTRSRSVVRGRSPSPEIMEARDPKDHDRRPHNTEHEYEDIVREADQFTAPLPAQDIIAAVAAIHADENRHPHDPNHPGHDEVQEEADRYWREMELARKLAKQHDNDPTPRVVTPPAMDHHSRDRDEEEKRREKGPYAEPDADFRFDHEMHPHEVPLFTPIALRKSFSLPEDFDDTQPFDPSLLGLKRPLLNIVRATPKPDENAKITPLKEPRSRSQSRERKSETSSSISQNDEKPTYGKPVEIEDEPSSTAREVADIPAITEPEAEAEAEKSVSWGENDTKVYVPVTPYDEARNPHDASRSIPSSPETTRAAPGGALPRSHAHEHHKEVESHSDSEKREIGKDKGKGKEKEKVREGEEGKGETPKKRPKPKSLWSRFTPDLAKRIQEREELAYNLANASTIGFADGDEGREVPRDEVAELALERGRRFNDPTLEDYGKRSADPELEMGEVFEYKGVIVEPEAPRKSKKKHRKHRDRTPSPPAVGPKPASPRGRMPGSFDSDAEVAFAKPGGGERGVSPPASDVSTVIYHQPSELSDSAGIATGFNSEIGIRPRQLDNEESFVDINKPTSSNESFEIVDKQPEETMVVTVEPAGEQPESFAVVDTHSYIPSEETQPLIVDAPTADGALGDRGAEVSATPATEDEDFVTPLAEVVTPFDATGTEIVPAPTIVEVAPFLGGSSTITPQPTLEEDLERSIDPPIDAPREVDTSAPAEEVPVQEMSTEAEASSSSKSKKKKKKGKKNASDEPEIIADTSVVETPIIEKKLVEAVPVAEDAKFPSAQEIAEEISKDKEIVIDLATPAIEQRREIVDDPTGETSKTATPSQSSKAEVVASEITERSASTSAELTRSDHDSITKSDAVAGTSGAGELGNSGTGVAPLDLTVAEDVINEEKAKDAKKVKKSLLDSDFAAVALAGTAAAVAGIVNVLTPGKKDEEKTSEPEPATEASKQISDVPATKESIDALAESWVAPEMPAGLNKKAKKAWTQKIAKEKEEFESAQANKEARGEDRSASIEKTKKGPAGAQSEGVDTTAPVAEDVSKEIVDAQNTVTSEDVEKPVEIVEPTPEAITTAGEAASYYDASKDITDALAIAAEPAAETNKDITDAASSSPIEEIQPQGPSEFVSPEMPAGLNKKGKKAWTQKVAKEKEDWEAAQTAAAQTSAVGEEKPAKIIAEGKDVAEPVVASVDTPVSAVEESNEKVIDALAQPSVEAVEAPIEIVEPASESIDLVAPSTDIEDSTGKLISSAPTERIAEAAETPAEVIESVPEIWQEPEMPTGLNKKQKTAWKKKVAKEKEEFESAQASKAASVEASGAQTPAMMAEEASKDMAEVIDTPGPAGVRSKGVVDAPSNITETLAAAAEESSKVTVNAPIEVIDAAPAIIDAPAPFNNIVEESSKDVIAAPIEPVAEVTETQAAAAEIAADPSTDIIKETDKEITSAPADPITEATSTPVIEVYEEPIMPTGLNKKQKQAWKKKVAKEKEEWESARSSAEQSGKESGMVTPAVVEVVDASAQDISEAPVPISGDLSKELTDAPEVVVIEAVDQPINEAIQPSTTEDIPVAHEAVQERSATIVLDPLPPAPEAGTENFEEAVRAIHDATSAPAVEPATEAVSQPIAVEEASIEIVEPVSQPIVVPEVSEKPVESSAENSSEPPKKMNKRERKAWDKAQREAAIAKALADEEAAAAASTPAPVEALETPQFEAPEILPTPVFEDESGAFATAPPETPLATPLETPIQVEHLGDSPVEGDPGVVSLSMEEAAALAASDSEAQAGDVSISIEEAAALAGEANVPTRELSKKEKKAAEKAARAGQLEEENSTATETEMVVVPVDGFKELVAATPADDVSETPLDAPFETPVIETPAEEAEVSLGGKKKKKKKGKAKAADVAEKPLETPVETPLETPSTEVVAPAVEQPIAEPVVEHDPVAETLALLGGISHSRALPSSSVQQSIEPLSIEQNIESPTDDDDAFHSAAEDRARSATPTGTVDDDDFHSTNGDGAWLSPRMNGHDQPEVVPEMAKEPEVTETEVTEDDAFAPVKGKKKKKRKVKGVGSSGVSSEDSVTEGAAASQESFLANAGTLGAGVGSAAAGPRDMNSEGNLGSEERNADAVGRWESQPRSLEELVEGDKVGEEKGDGTVVGHDEGGDVLAGQTLTWGRKREVVSDPVEETRRVLEGIEHSSGTKERRVVSDPFLNDPEITKREVMPGIDPQFGDLLPLPPRDSPPNEEVDAGALVTDLPPTPADAPFGFQPLGGIQEQAEPSEVKAENFTIDPEIHPRSIRPAIDPQFGDLLELPPSQPGSPVRQIDDDAISMQLPDSPPESPAVARTSLEGARESPQTPRRKDTTHSMRSPSINAVPLKFLLGGRASGSTPSSPVTGIATSPTRPKSRHSWDSSKGLQPLTLLSGMERRHSRGSSLAEFESRSLATLLEAAAQDKDNMSTADTAVNTAVEEQAEMTGTDGENTDAFATAVSEKPGEEYFSEVALGPVEAPSVDIADTIVPASIEEVAEQSTKGIPDPPVQIAPEVFVESEMPTGLNKKQKAAWKKKVAKEKAEWESARSSAEHSERQMTAAQDAPAEAAEPAAQVVDAPAAIDEKSSKDIDAPIEVVGSVPEAINVSAPFTDIVQETSKVIADAPAEPATSVRETSAQTAIEEAISAPASEVYEEPEMPTGLNKKQKQAWKKKVAKEKEEWESARSAQSSAEQSSGGWTDTGDQKSSEDYSVPNKDLPIVEESQDVSRDVELEEPVEPSQQAPSDVIEPPSILADPAPASDNGDFANVLQQIPIEQPSETAVVDLPAIEASTVSAQEPIVSNTVDDVPANVENVSQSQDLEWQEPEMPTGLNKKQKTAWKKKIAKDREEWESAQSSAEQTGDRTTAVDDAPSEVLDITAPVVEKASKDFVDIPIDSTPANFEAPVEVVEPSPKVIDAKEATAGNEGKSSKETLDVLPTAIIETPVIEDTTQPIPEAWQEPEMPSGLNKKQKMAWKKKIIKDREDWESAQSSAEQTGDQTPALVETPIEAGDVPAPIVEEASKESMEAPAEGSVPIVDEPAEVLEATPKMTEARAPSTKIVEESSKDIIGTSVDLIDPATISNVVAEESTKDIVDVAAESVPNIWQEPEMASGLNKKQKTAWKMKVARETEDWESAQSSTSATEAEAVQGAPVPEVVESAKGIAEPISEVINAPIPVVQGEENKEVVDVLPTTETEVVAAPFEAIEPVSEQQAIPSGQAISYYNEDSKDITEAVAKPASEIVKALTDDSPLLPAEPEVYQEPEMPSGLNKKQKTAWKKKVAKEREEWDKVQASSAQSDVQTPVVEEASKDISDAPAEVVEVVEVLNIQETPKLEIGGFIETPAAEITEPILAPEPTEEPSSAPIVQTPENIVDTPVEVVSDPSIEAPIVDGSQPAKKLNKKQKAALAKKLKEEAESASVSTSGGWTDSGAHTPAEGTPAQPIRGEAPTNVVTEPIAATQEVPLTPQEPSSGSITDFDAAVRALHDKFDEPVQTTPDTVDVMTYLETPAEGETTAPATAPVPETPLKPVFVAPEMPTGLNKKQKKAWEKNVQNEREEWESEQASKEASYVDKEKSAEESELLPSANGFSTDAPVEQPQVKTEPVDPTIYDVSDAGEQPIFPVPDNVAIQETGPRTSAIALPAYGGGGEAESYFEGGPMRMPSRAASPALESLVNEAQILDEGQVSESAGERGDVDSSAFETASSKKSKKKKKGKEIAVESAVVEVPSPVQERKDVWAYDMDDEAPKVIAAPTMLPAIVKDAFSRPPSPEAVTTPTGKKSKKKKGKKGVVEEVETPAANEPSLEAVAMSTEPAPEAPFEQADEALPAVLAELETAKEIEEPASSIQPSIEIDANDSPPTPDAVRETLALLGGISHTREPVIKTSRQPDQPAEVVEGTAAAEQEAKTTEDTPTLVIEASQEQAPAIIEMPVMPKGLNKKQKKAWEKKNAALIAEAEASQAASAAVSGSQTSAIQVGPREVIEETVKDIVHAPPAIEPLVEDAPISQVSEALREFIAEPSPIHESKAILDGAPLPEAQIELTKETIDLEVARKIPLPEAPLDTPFEPAFESASSTKKKKKGKQAATVETETESDPVTTTLPADAANVLESDTIKDVEAVEAPQALIKDAMTTEPIAEAITDIPEESAAMVDTLEPSIARNVPLPDSSGDATPAEVSTETETTFAWEEPEMPKGLNKKKKAEWKKKMAKEKEEWESAQALAASQTPAEVFGGTLAPEPAMLEAPILKDIEEPATATENVEGIHQPRVLVDDTPLDAPTARTPEEPAAITDDFEPSIARNIILPESEMPTPIDSPAESAFESASSKKSRKNKGKKGAVVLEEESASPVPERFEEALKGIGVVDTPTNEAIDEPQKAAIERVIEAPEIVQSIPRPATRDEAAEYHAAASKDISGPPTEPAVDTTSAPAVDDDIQAQAEVWEDPIMPTGLNKKKRDAWKKKVAKEKEEWVSARASTAVSAQESGAQTPVVRDTPDVVVKEMKQDVEMPEVVPIPETALEERIPAFFEDNPFETSREVVLDDAPNDQAIVIDEIAKDIPLPETPMETTESSAFESLSFSKSKKKKKGKKGAAVLEEESVSPAPDIVEETQRDVPEISDEGIDGSVDIPADDSVTISEPILQDTVMEIAHPETPNAEPVQVSVETHEESSIVAEPISQDNQDTTTLASGANSPFVSVSINEASGSPSDRTPDPEKTEEPMENTEAPKTAFLEHSASGNGSSLPREMQGEMEQQVLVSGAGAEGVGSYGDEGTKDVGEEKDESGGASESIDDTAGREMPGGLNKKQKKAWEKAEKKRVEEAFAAADAKALRGAAKVGVEEINKEVADERLAVSVEAPAVAEVVEWKPTRNLSRKEQKAVDKKSTEEEEEEVEEERARFKAEANREKDRFAAIEEQIKAPSVPVKAEEETSHQNVTEPEPPVENIGTPQETPAEDERSAPTRKLSKKEQKAADKKRRHEEEQAELYAALKSEREPAEAEAKIQDATTPITADATREVVKELSTQGTETPVDTPAEGEWAPTRKLSKKEKKALDKKRRDADEQALVDAAAAATATAAAIATVALVTGDDKPASPSQDVEEPAKEKQFEITTSIEEASKLDSGNESPPANTKVKRRDKGKGRAIEIVDTAWSVDSKTPNDSKGRSISMENQPSQVMSVGTPSQDRGIFQQALEKVVEKQVQQRDLQEKVQENITAQAVKGSWSFSSLEDDKEENTAWSASRLPPVLEEDVVLEQPRTPDDATRSRSPIYRGIDKEDSAYVGAAESPKPRPRSWFDPEYVRDSGVLLREKKSSDSQKSFSERANTDEALLRRSWPPVDDENESVDLRRKNRSSLKDSQSSPYEKITPKDIAKAATGLGIAGGHKHSLSKSPALSESPSREFLLRKANRSQTPSTDEKLSTTLSRQPNALRDVGRTETPRSASDRQQQRQSSLLESLHNDSPRSVSDNINSPRTRTRTPSGISREEYYNRGLSATPTSERGATGLGSVLSRPGSVVSSRSVTPSLRRVSGRASTDLRAASQLALATTNREEGARAQPCDADSGSASDNNKPSHQGDNTKDKDINTSDVSATSDSRAPAPNEGKKRVKGMAEVYNGFGEGRMGSPRSPTRPHSMRRKQSMQLLDMQAQMAAMVEELAAARQENAVILQAKEAAERNLDEARREAGKAQQYKAQAEEVRGLLESMTLKNTDLTRQTLDLQAMLEERENGAQATIAAAVASAIASKEEELVRMRQRAERLSHDWSGDEREIEELEAIIADQKLEIVSLKQSRPTTVNGPDYLAEYARDDAYFEQSCQKLFRGVWRWIHAFSDRRKHSISDLEDIKNLEDPRIYQWMKDAFTGNPSSYLADLDKRRLILMALTMSLFHHYIFNKHFFGLTKDQEEASKVLEIVVDNSDISDSEFRLWRAQQFCLFSKARNYSTQRNDEVLGVTSSVMRKLSDVLPQPSSSPSDDQRTKILIEELKIIVKKAAELSNDMRRQSTKYSWRQSERALWSEKRTRTTELFEAGKMTHAEICVQFMELHRVDEKLSDPNLTPEVHAGLERERMGHIQSLVHDFHVISESEITPAFRLSWEEMVRRMEEKNRRIEEKGMSVRLSLFPMVVKEGEEGGKVVIWKSVVKPVDLKSGAPSGKRRAGGESSVGGSEHGSKHPRVR